MMNKNEDVFWTVRDYSLEQSWFAERAKLFSRFNVKELEINEVQFNLSNMKDGIIDWHFYVDGSETGEIILSSDSYPLPKIKLWLEKIVDDTIPIASMSIVDDNLYTIFCYEHILPAEIGWDRNSGDFDAHNCYDVGLFYVYSSKRDVIESYAVCKTKDFVERLYMTFLCFAGFRGDSRKNLLDFTENWYWDSEFGFMSEVNKGMTWDDIKLKWNNWTFYNEIKSTKIEWNAISDLPYRHNKLHFQESALVNEMINMWAEWGDALFWSVDGCCGDCKVIHTDSGDIDLSRIDGLKEWYEEFDHSDPCVKWSKEKLDKWDKRGWQLAMKVREVLPDNIDLCYYWLLNKFDIKGVAPLMRLVPNQRFGTTK